MQMHEHEDRHPRRGDHEGPVCEIIYRPVDPGGDEDIERRLNEAFDVLFAKAAAIDS